MKNPISEKEKKSTNKKRVWQPKAWKPGQSGNPKGRPISNNSLAECIRKIADELADNNHTRLDIILRRLFDDAAQGRTQATALLLERGWGKVAQPIVGEDGTLTKIVLQWSEYDGNGNRIPAIAQVTDGGEESAE